MSRARAHANIALVKYWGKRDRRLNTPAAGSLSLTLEALTTETEVTFGHDKDRLILNDAEIKGPGLARLARWLDRVRALAGAPGESEAEASVSASEFGGALVVSTNDFPTASGLASSASAYAALALAASDAAGLVLEPTELSILARLGSGSAARSIFGGLVTMRAGHRDDGTDAYAESLATRAELKDFPLAMVVAVVGGGLAKAVSSRDAMEHCAETSPLYRGWLESVPGDLVTARGAVSRRDFHALGEVCEQSALAMHAAALASRPAISYFRPETIALMDRVRTLRRETDIAAYFTMDAGPHVKVLTDAASVEAVADAIAEVDGVSEIITSGIGGPAALIE